MRIHVRALYSSREGFIGFEYVFVCLYVQPKHERRNYNADK